MRVITDRGVFSIVPHLLLCIPSLVIDCFSTTFTSPLRADAVFHHYPLPIPIAEVAALLQRPGLLVDEKLNPEKLQRTFGERPLLHLYAQGYLPAHIESGPCGSFGIGNLIVGLQQKCYRQQAAGNPRHRKAVCHAELRSRGSCRCPRNADTGYLLKTDPAARPDILTYPLPLYFIGTTAIFLSLFAQPRNHSTFRPGFQHDYLPVVDAHFGLSSWHRHHRIALIALACYIRDIRLDFDSDLLFLGIDPRLEGKLYHHLNLFEASVT